MKNRFLVLCIVVSVLILATIPASGKRRNKPTKKPRVQYPTPKPKTQKEIEVLLKKDKIIPDVIDYAPNDTVVVVYKGNKTVDFGNEFTFKEVKEEPIYVNWFLHDEYEVYVLLLLGPDAPTAENPTYRCFNHWLIGNIPEKRLYGAELFASYTIATKAYEPGVHRFVFVMYKQPERDQLEFAEERVFRKYIGNRRVNFSAPNFATKYKLGTPSAVNYFKINVK